MKSLFTLALTLVLTASAFAGNGTDKKNNDKAQKWNFDKSHSGVTFSIRHFFTPVVGQFNEFGGDVYFDAKNLAASSINVSLDVTSVDTKNEKRDGHLETADFFDAAKYPKITFVSTEIVKAGENSYIAKGKLTIKDVTKDIELPFKLLGTMPHPFMKDGTLIAAFEASLKLNRNEFGVGTGNYVQTTVIGDEVDVKITLEMLSVK